MTQHSARLTGLAAAAFVASAALMAFPVRAQVVDLGTDSIGSVVNTTGSAIAKVISQHSGLNVRTRAYSGPEGWMPEVDAGKIQLGAHFTATFYTMYNKFETELHLTNLRVIRSSLGTAPLGFIVKADSPIKSVADLRGKRVAGDFGAQPVLRVMSEASMNAYGFSYREVSMVPMANVVQGVAAVVDGRVDASWASTAMPQVREAHTKVGVRFIPLPLSAQQEDEFRKKSFPSLYIDKFGSAETPWLPPDTPMMTQEMYVGASIHTQDDVVKKVAQTLWDHDTELMKAHPVMIGFSNKAAVTARPVVPYHPAAVAFYKEKGVWTDAADKASAALIVKK